MHRWAGSLVVCALVTAACGLSVHPERASRGGDDDAGAPGTDQGGATTDTGTGGSDVETGGTATGVAGTGDETAAFGGSSGNAGHVGTGGAGGAGGSGTVGGGGAGGRGGSGGASGRGAAGTAGSSSTMVRIEELDFRLTLEDCAALEAKCVHGVGCDSERHGFIVRDGSDLVLVIAGDGELDAMKLWPDSGNFSTNLSAYLEPLAERAAPPVSLQAGPFNVWLTDQNGDGVAETLRFAGPGTCYNGSDLDIDRSDVDVAVTGTPTASSPRFEVRGDGWYQPLELWSNQPLALTSTAKLVAPDGTSLRALPVARSWRTDGNDEFVFKFTVNDDVPRDTALTWELDAANTAGGLAPPSVLFESETAWVPLGDLGFEDGVDAHVVGSAEHSCARPAEPPRILSTIGGISALEGQASLFVPAGLDVALLLDRPAGATKLVLKSLPLHAGRYTDLPTFGLRTRRGEPVVESPWTNDSIGGGSSDSSDQYEQAGIERTVELPLPEERGDLILEIHTTCSSEFGYPSASGAWVDALEFEFE